MIVSLAQTQLFFLALTRVLATIIHVPVLGGNSIPNQVKLGLGIFLTIIIIPWQPLSSDAEGIALVAFVINIAQQMLIGTIIGFASVLTFMAVQIAGEMMGWAAGFTSSKVLNPAFGDNSSSMEQLFVMVATILFLVLNGHLTFIAALARTFSLVPVTAQLPQFSLENLLSLFTQMISLGIQLSLPVLGAVLLTDITLGLLARVAPQVQVFFLGLPLKIVVGLFVLFLALSTLLPIIGNQFNHIGNYLLNLLGA